MKSDIHNITFAACCNFHSYRATLNSDPREIRARLANKRLYPEPVFPIYNNNKQTAYYELEERRKTIEILLNKKHLKGTNLYIAEHFPLDILVVESGRKKKK